MAVTIKDIANVAGVSYSTVSKALNDSPLVKPNTKSKILTIAKDLGYEPNFAARRLVSKQTRTIGVVWPTVERIALSTLIMNINEEIEKRSYSMILSINSVDSAIEMFKRFQVDGIMVFEETNSNLKDHPVSNIPCISYGASVNQTIPMIDVNYKRAMYLAVKYLFQLGHSAISFIGDFSPVDQRQIEKYQGFLEAMKSFGLPIHDQSVINTGGLEWHDGYVATKRILNSSNLPTAIIGSSYDISAGIIRGLKEENFIIPKDISVIGYDNIPQMANLEIPLTAIGIPVETLAAKIVDSLFQQIIDPHSIPTDQSMEPEIKERTSCAHPKQQ